MKLFFPSSLVLIIAVDSSSRICSELVTVSSSDLKPAIELIHAKNDSFARTR